VFVPAIRLLTLLLGLMLGYGAIETADIAPSLDRVRDILLQLA